MFINTLTVLKGTELPLPLSRLEGEFSSSSSRPTKKKKKGRRKKVGKKEGTDIITVVVSAKCTGEISVQVLRCCRCLACRTGLGLQTRWAKFHRTRP